jgi:hypothetical protein
VAWGVKAHYRRWLGEGSGLVGLHLKIMLVGKLFAVSRDWLFLGEAFPPRQRVLCSQNIQNTENKKEWLISQASTTASQQKFCQGCIMEKNMLELSLHH